MSLCQHCGEEITKHCEGHWWDADSEEACLANPNFNNCHEPAPSPDNEPVTVNVPRQNGTVDKYSVRRASPDSETLRRGNDEQPTPQCPTPFCSACHPSVPCQPDCHICHNETLRRDGEGTDAARLCFNCDGTVGSCDGARIKCCPDCTHDYPGTAYIVPAGYLQYLLAKQEQS